MGQTDIFILLIMVIPTYFLTWLIFRKYQPQTNHYKNPAVWLTTLIATPIIYYGFFLFLFISATYYPKRDFDKQQWATEVNRRYEFADDLVDNNKLIGKTKEEVIELLSAPYKQTETTLTYCLGYEPFGSIDPNWLDINFKDGRVINCIIYNS